MYRVYFINKDNTDRFVLCHKEAHREGLYEPKPIPSIKIWNVVAFPTRMIAKIQARKYVNF